MLNLWRLWFSVKSPFFFWPTRKECVLLRSAGGIKRLRRVRHLKVWKLRDPVHIRVSIFSENNHTRYSDTTLGAKLITFKEFLISNLYQISIKLIIITNTMVVLFCHHLPDNYDDLLTCQIFMSTCQKTKPITTSTLIFCSYRVLMPITAKYLSISYLTSRHNFLTSQHNDLKSSFWTIVSTCQIMMPTCQIFLLTCQMICQLIRRCSCYLYGIELARTRTFLRFILNLFNEWQVNIKIWQDDQNIWKVNIIIWQVVAEIFHHTMVSYTRVFQKIRGLLP